MEAWSTSRKSDNVVHVQDRLEPELVGAAATLFFGVGTISGASTSVPTLVSASTSTLAIVELELLWKNDLLSDELVKEHQCCCAGRVLDPPQHEPENDVPPVGIFFTSLCSDVTAEAVVHGEVIQQ